MILNFDKTKYPLDHEWIDDNRYDYYKNVFNEVFVTSYSITCIKCKLHIVHRKLNINFEEYENIILYDENDWYMIDYSNDWTDLNNENLKNILTCAETQIKKLLE